MSCNGTAADGGGPECAGRSRPGNVTPPDLPELVRQRAYRARLAAIRSRNSVIQFGTTTSW
jgi:hypothetical protein